MVERGFNPLVHEFGQQKNNVEAIPIHPPILQERNTDDQEKYTLGSGCV